MRRVALPIAAAGLIAFGSAAAASTDTTTAQSTTDASDAATASSAAATTDGAATTEAAGSTAPVGTVPADCGPDSDVWFEPGTLTAATGEPAYPPYVVDDKPESGEGFESAVVYAVADTLGFAADAVKWVRTTFDEAIAPGPKQYDFNIQQYAITAQRDEIVDFSLPYYDEQKTLLAPADSEAAKATTFADLQGLKFGATIGTTDLDYIVNTIGIPEDDVAVYNDQAATFAALDAGQIDATVIGLPTALYVTGVEMPQIAIVGLLPRTGGQPTEETAPSASSETSMAAGGTETSAPTEITAAAGAATDTTVAVDPNAEQGMGMLFEEGNPARDCVNAALEILAADGTLAELDTTWMQSGGDIPEITE